MTATSPIATTVRARRNRRLAIGLAVCVVLLAVVCCLSLAVGSRSIPLGTVWRSFTGYDGSRDHLIIRQLRQPRTLIGLLAGTCLGLSGAVMQGLTHNPLADPGVLGIDAGAALAVVIGIHSFGVVSASGFIWFAFAGAAVASVLVYGLGSMGRHAAAPVRLALAGMAVAAIFGAFTTSILLTDDQTLDQFRFWVVGSLAGRDMTVVRAIAPFAVVATAVALLTSRPLNTLALGEDSARALGASIFRSRVVCSVAIVLTAGTATAACGPIGFIGLTVPHIVRHWTGPEHRWLLPYTAVVAPMLLLGADIIGRIVDRPSEIQVGIITAIFGAPFFIAVARRTKIAGT
ncbi:MAG: iron chelate uptake ABC transporter family permease subunit [Ilumatobacteraceae bacterium]